MEDEDFDSLLAEAELLQDSSQASLTSAAANLGVSEHYLSNFEPVIDSLPEERESRHHETYERANQYRHGGTGASKDVSSASKIIDYQIDGSPVNGRPQYSSQDQSCNPNGEMGVHSSRQVVMQKIERIFESFTDSLFTNGKELVVTLKARPKSR